MFRNHLIPPVKRASTNQLPLFPCKATPQFLRLWGGLRSDTRGSTKEGSRTVQVVAPSGQSAQNRVKGKEELKAGRGGFREGHSMNGDNYILEW